jgi:hypothetical protein
MAPRSGDKTSAYYGCGSVVLLYQMKKLLLVMLVPVLVLGVMSCGKGFDAGDPLPTDLQGTWEGQASTPADGVIFTIAGNQASVGFICDEGYSLEDGDDIIEIKGVTPFRVGISVHGEAKLNDIVGTADDDENYFEIEFNDFTAKKNTSKGKIRGFFTDAGEITIFFSQGENYFYGLPPCEDYTN